MHVYFLRCEAECAVYLFLLVLAMDFGLWIWSKKVNFYGASPAGEINICFKLKVVCDGFIVKVL